MVCACHQIAAEQAEEATAEEEAVAEQQEEAAAEEAAAEQEAAAEAPEEVGITTLSCDWKISLWLLMRYQRGYQPHPFPGGGLVIIASCSSSTVDHSCQMCGTSPKARP